MDANAKKVASLYGDIGLEDNVTDNLKGIKGQFAGFGDSVSAAGENLRKMGAGMTAVVSGPILAAGIATVKMASDFDNSMANISSVTGATGDDLKKLGNDLLAVGATSVAGPQAVADAYYDVAGGVADASSRMAILQAAIALSEAGQADLGASTAGMISIMNSFGFSADKAGFAADVLTKTVGVGVGSMDEFVAAMGPIAGTVNAAGISVDDFAAGVAFMTTKGMSASQAATGYRAAINSLLNPNAEMAKALKKAGIASASAAIKQDGLAAVIAKVNAAVGESPDKLTAAMGSTEAYGAAVNLASKDFTGFAADMKSGIDGATEAARKLQTGGFQNQFAKLSSGLRAIGISIGEIFLPYINQAVEGISNFVGSIMTAAPEMIPLIVGIAGAVAAIGPLTMALGFLLSPIGLVVGGLVALGAAFATNFGGIRDMLQPVIDGAKTLFADIVAGAQKFITDVQTLGLKDALVKWFNAGVDWLKTEGPGILTGAVGMALNFASNVVDFVKSHAPDLLAGLIGWATNVIDTVGPQIKSIIAGAVGGAINFADNIVQWVKEKAPGIGTALVTWLFDSAVDLANQGGVIVSDALGKGLAMFTNAAEVVKKNAPDIGFAIGEWIRSGLTWLTTEAPKLVTNALAGLFGGGGGGAQGAASQGSQVGAGYGDGLTTAMATSLTAGTGVFATALEGIKTLFAGVFAPDGFIAGLFEGLFGLKAGTLKAAWDGIFGPAGVIATSIEDAKKYVSAFADKFTDVKNAITNAFKGVLQIILQPFVNALKKLGAMLQSVGWVAGVNVGEIGDRLVGAASSIAGSYEGAAGPPSSLAPGRASGGAGTRGMGYSVFDKGGLAAKNREVFVPKVAGDFVPLDGGGGKSVTNVWNVAVNGIPDLGRALDQLEARAGRKNRSIIGARA